MTRRIPFVPVVPVAALVLSALTSAGCSFYTVHGHVWSCAERRPVEGASVHLSDGRADGVARSGADGSFETTLAEPESDAFSRLTVAKVGYRTSRHDVDSPRAEQNVCLEPESRDLAVAAPP
jgi:hypothetical protein